MATNPIYQVGEVADEVLRGCTSYRIRTDWLNCSVYVVKRSGGYAHYAQVIVDGKIRRQFAGYAAWMTNEKLSAAIDQLRRDLFIK